MREIIVAIGASIAVSKGISAMTKDAGESLNVWFRIFRAVSWLSMSGVCLLGLVWVAKQVFA